MKQELSEFEMDREFDMYNLHREYNIQPRLYGKWSTRKAEASKIKFVTEEALKVIRTEAKRNIEEKRAEIDLEIRRNWDNKTHPIGKFFRGIKPTESAISNYIILDEGFKKVQDDEAKKIKDQVDALADAIENYEYLDGAVFAMTQRKNSIEGEINLWINGYYSDPKIPKEFKRADHKQIQQTMKKTLKKKSLTKEV